MLQKLLPWSIILISTFYRSKLYHLEWLCETPLLRGSSSIASQSIPVGGVFLSPFCQVCGSFTQVLYLFRHCFSYVGFVLDSMNKIHISL